MKELLIIVSILFWVFGHWVSPRMLAQEPGDTAMINRINREAYLIARKVPERALEMSHMTLELSRKRNYKRGLADASLALGMAHLAKFNHADSAYIYNMKALALYEAMEDIHGMAMACYALSYVYSFRGDLKESEKYSALSLEYFKQVGDKRGMVNAYDALAYLAKQQNDLDQALAYIHSAVETARLTNDTLPLAGVLNSLGNIYKEMGLFKNAIDTYFEALLLWEKKRDSTGLSMAYGSIGLLYYYQQDYEEALKFNFKKLPIAQSKGELWEVSKTYNTLVHIFNAMDQHDSALYYNRRSLSLTRQMNYKSGMVAAYHNMATTMLLKSEVDSAFFYGNKAVELARRIYDPLLVNSLITLGRIYGKQKQYQPALVHALEAYGLAKQHNRPLVLSEAAGLVSDLYHLVGQKDKAYDYLKEFQQINDSINNEAFHKKITRLDLQYEYDKREKAAEFVRMEDRLIQTSRIERQGFYLKGMLILVFLLVIISGLFIRHSRFRVRYVRMDLEQRLLRARMNPHFIFNALCAVQDFILAGKPLKANVFLTKIARLMRNILEHTRQEYVPLDQEIDTLKLYLDLQQMRFSQEFEYHLSVDEAIDPENLAVPPMLAQPCVENSIEHGLLPLGQKGHLNISYRLKNGLLLLEVTDDGVGRKQAALKSEGPKMKKSLSTSLTQKRLEHLRKSLNQKAISFEITDLYDGDEAKGTKVVMLLPYKMIYA